MSRTYYLDHSGEKSEIYRLDVQHRIWQILLDGQLITAPHSQLTTVLDLGCGSAVWTSEVAKQFPQARVVGVDITPPSTHAEQANLAFRTADIEKPWGFVEECGRYFDLISARVLVSAISDWPQLLQRCRQHLKPGGWIEIADIMIGTFSGSFDWRDETSPLMRWYQCYRKGASQYGIDGFASQKRASHLADAGFTRIAERVFHCYLADEGMEIAREGNIARLMKQNMFGLLDAVTKTMQERGQWDVMGITSSELQQLKEDARLDVSQNACSRKYYWIYSVHIGQRPVDTETTHQVL